MLRYRGRAVMQLLWRGIAAYVFAHEIDLLFGCASLAGTDPDVNAAELTYLHHNHLAPPALRPRALPRRTLCGHAPSAAGNGGCTQGAADLAAAWSKDICGSAAWWGMEP